jgi:hypothetical protein
VHDAANDFKQSVSNFVIIYFYIIYKKKKKKKMKKVGIQVSGQCLSQTSRMRSVIRHFPPNRFFRQSQYGAARYASISSAPNGKDKKTREGLTSKCVT